MRFLQSARRSTAHLKASHSSICATRCINNAAMLGSSTSGPGENERALVVQFTLLAEASTYGPSCGFFVFV
jgi:hypothetical protein